MCTHTRRWDVRIAMNVPVPIQGTAFQGSFWGFRFGLVHVGRERPKQARGPFPLHTPHTPHCPSHCSCKSQHVFCVVQDRRIFKILRKLPNNVNTGLCAWWAFPSKCPPNVEYLAGMCNLQTPPGHTRQPQVLESDLCLCTDQMNYLRQRTKKKRAVSA